jgi:hypothetical protein
MKQPDNSAAIRAQEQAAKAAAEAQLAANNLKSNLSKDLSTENMSKIVAGGSAAALDTATGSTQRKKRPTGSLSSQLGVNV